MFSKKESELENKVVLITGSSLGIGRETAYKFAKEKAKIVITYYKDKDEALKVSEKCLALGASDVLIVQLNLMDDNGIKNAVKEIIDKFKEVHILINNAGVVVWKYLKEQSKEDIESQIRTNLEGLIKMTRECLPYVRDTIINIASGAGKTGYADLTTYCATKFGVRGFTQSLAEELDIKIYSVNPTMTKTRMTDFQGMEPEKVAEVILNTAKGKYRVSSGSDIDVQEVV